MKRKFTTSLDVREATRMARSQVYEERKISRSRYPVQKLDPRTVVVEEKPSDIVAIPMLPMRAESKGPPITVPKERALKPYKPQPTGIEVMHYLIEYIIGPMEQHRAGMLHLFEHMADFELVIHSYDGLPPLFINAEFPEAAWRKHGFTRFYYVGQYDGDGENVNSIVMDAAKWPLSFIAGDEIFPVYELGNKNKLRVHTSNIHHVNSFIQRWARDLVSYGYHKSILDIDMIEGRAVDEWLR